MTKNHATTVYGLHGPNAIVPVSGREYETKAHLEKKLRKKNVLVFVISKFQMRLTLSLKLVQFKMDDHSGVINSQIKE